MIVQCAKCETKFRFDESLIQGEGVWVRCSRCRNVFFIENEKKEEIVMRNENISPFETRQGDENIKSLAKDKEDILAQPPPYMRLSNNLEKEKDIFATRDDLEKERSSREELIEDIAKDTFEDDEDQKEQKGKTEAKEKSAGGSQRKNLIYLLVLILVSGAYLLFTDTGQQAMNLVTSSVSSIVGKITGSSQKEEEVGPAQVEVNELRQYFVSNAAIGNIRVVEGVAVNKSKHTMTRIRVKAGLYGEGNIIIEKESYCGNLLSYDELSSMHEPEIHKELLNPSGSDVSNDRIMSGGQIPFMIVFFNEPPGVLKTFVVPSGAERLLP